jgi:hypothetical protein
MTYPSVTHVSVYNTIDFADPYKICNAYGGWITGVLDKPGQQIVVPCEHHKGYSDVCPSWGPVDGCQCQAHLGHVPHGESRTRS